jgi:hypothetical protein
MGKNIAQLSFDGRASSHLFEDRINESAQIQLILTGKITVISVKQ